MQTICEIANDVYQILGAGHTESVYHNAMKIGLQEHHLMYESERDILIMYHDKYVGTVRADLIVENKMVIELKVSMGTDTAITEAKEQCLLYMQKTLISEGMVIVFPKRSSAKIHIEYFTI
jgi:GxxExxY protein